ncbi:MAG: hypothetical protein K2O14_02360 [Oscillospiraceae bacterium]|nr:hypothetical protein [Oscillospiraceae bacterium]
MFKNMGKRILVRICTSIIAFAIAGVIFLVQLNTGTNKVGRLLNNDYYDNYTAYMGYLADFDMENAEKSLTKCTKAVDKIAAVSLDDKNVEAKIDTLAVEEKSYLNNIFRCFSILSDPDSASEADLNWAQAFLEVADSSDSFYREVYRLIA